MCHAYTGKYLTLLLSSTFLNFKIYYHNIRHSVLCHLQYRRGKSHPRRGHEGAEGEYMYGSTLSLTSAIDVGGQQHAPAALTPGKTQ